MATIYYPHLDLENRKLLNTTPDHVVNIKLLTLMADHVLILSSHLLDAKADYLYMIKNGLSSFITDGKIETVLYDGYHSLEDYLYHKTETVTSPVLHIEYQEKANYISTQIFRNSNHFICVDNEQEREQFHSIYVNTNLDKARQTGNTWLIHSALKFRDEIYRRKDQKASYLTLPEANQVLCDLMSSGQIKETHYPFFLKNQIGAYYYSGSLANSAIVAFNPYFDDIRFDKITSEIGYHSTRAYDPTFFLNVLISLNIINDSEDIKYLSSKDVDIIRNHKAWKDFQDLFSILYDEAFIFNEFIKREQDVQRKMEWIKGLLFSAPFGVVGETLLSPISTAVFPGILGIAISNMLNYLAGSHRTVRLVRESTIDRIVENFIASKEPLYVITSRLKRTVDKIMHR